MQFRRTRTAIVGGFLLVQAFSIFLSVKAYDEPVSQYAPAIAEKANAIVEEALSEPTLEEAIQAVELIVQAREAEQAKLAEEQKQQTGKQEVAITSFYDSSFGSGLKLKGLRTNKYGMTVDKDGYVVVATATQECINSNKGGCKMYKVVKKGHKVWKYGDTFDIQFDALGVTLKAKVYDSCGACFWKEEYQRVDVHMKSGKSLGKVRGRIIFKT